MTRDALRSACLWGDQHTAIGETRIEPLGADLAVGISRGRFPKPLPSVDDNEDAVLAAAAAGRVLLAVADGHRGFDAAEAAIGAVHERLPLLLWEAGDGADALQQTVDAATRAIRLALSDVDPERAHSRTALSVALAVDGVLLAVGFGDTTVVRVPVRGRPRLVVKPTGFLGPVPAHRDVVAARLRRGDHVLLASDGLNDALGRDWLRHVGKDGAGCEDAGAGVGQLLAAALRAGAHDNVALALWTGA